MRKVTIYQYTVLDVNRIEPRKARRWGTRKAIESLKVAEIVEESATLVDESLLTNGFTELGFDPRRG
jgi:hypothetical protein